MNIKPDRITHFEVAFRKSQKHGVKFNIIAPNTLEELDKARINLKSQLFIDFHIAISPNVPVVLFEINSPQEVGSPVWNINLNGSRLYHIPPKSYSYLDEFVNETEFLISQDILIQILEKEKIYISIFNALPDIYHEKGLVVLGLYNENNETEV